MFKRIALTLVFLATIGLVSTSLPSAAQAWRYSGGPYRSYYYGPPRAYGYYARPYRSYYYGPPRAYAPYYSYYGPGYYYNPGISIGVGF